MRDLQSRIDVLPGVRKTVSFVDICEMLDRSTQGRWSHQAVMVRRTGKASTAKQTVKKTTFWENPSQLDDILQRVSQLGPESFASTFINQDFSRANILGRTELARSSDIRTLIDTIHRLRAELFPPEIDVHPTGSLVLLTRSTGDLIAGQIYSLSLAALAIFVVMAIMFLSVRIGFLAMIPNIFPILIFFGLMGAFGATLNLGTSVVASIALGISVDNTIHFMSRLSSDMRHTADQEQALVQTLSAVGKGPWDLHQEAITSLFHMK
jgi:predicted RND superfamily exporter protein